MTASKASDRTLDPITFAVVRHGLISAAHEMYWVFKRTAMLPLLYEFNDFGMSLFDDRLNLIADAPGLPILGGTLETCLEATIEALGGRDEIKSGDAFFNNHPYMTAGQTADAAVMSPIFYQDQLVGFSALRGHMGDVGAMNLYPTDSVDLYQEGTILPAVKLYQEGELNTTVTRIIEANSRLPTETVGSILAGAGATRACGRKVQALVEKYGLDVYYATISELLDHAERMTRSAIAEIPDGVYSIEEFMDDNGRDDQPVKLACTVTIEASDIKVDVSDSAEEQAGAINCPWGYTLSACRFALKRLTTPDLPTSSGGYRPLQVTAPEGSIFNPASPAPVFCGIWTAVRLGDMIIDALAPAIPERAPAGLGGDLVVILAYLEHPETRKISFFLDLGGIGTGAVRDRDGTSGLMHPCQAGSESIPAEILETRMPVLKRRCELVQDSGGPGRFRGGLSTIAEFELLGDGAATVVCEKARASGGQGLDGGMPPPFKNAIIMFPNTDNEAWYGKKADIPIRSGDIVLIRPAGGGGYGSPLEREPERVMADVRNDYVSAEQARDTYGIVFIDGSGEVDTRATKALRNRLRKESSETPASTSLRDLGEK